MTCLYLCPSPFPWRNLGIVCRSDVIPWKAASAHGGIPQLFQPYRTTQNLPTSWTHTISIYIFSISSSTTLGSRGCPVTHWAPALLTGSKPSGPQEGTIYRHLPSASDGPARKGWPVPQRAALPRRQKLSGQGKLDFTSLCLGVCFRKLHIPEQSFRIYPNCSVRCKTEPSGYVWLG